MSNKYKIGYINARGADPKTGVGSYRHELLKAMVKVAGDYEIDIEEIPTLTKFSKVSKSFTFLFKSYDLIHFETDCHWYLGAWLKKLILGKRFKTLITMHGVFPVTYPEYMPKIQTFRTKYILQKMFPLIDGIVTVSMAEKEMIAREMDIDISRIFVTYSGNNMLEFSTKELRKNGMPTQFGNYILHVSNGAKWSKNPELLIRSFKEFVDDHPEFNLLIIGEGWKSDKGVGQLISSLNLEGKVFRKGHMERENLAKYYKNAKIYLQTSIHESFCLPIVEAMTFSTPVVSTRANAVPEVAKEGAIYVKENPDSVAGGLKKLLQNEELYNEKSRKAKKVATSYTWTKTARKTLEVYLKLLEAE